MSLDLLLDTHTLLWWMHQPDSLSVRARDAIADDGSRIFVSAVSAMEISTKGRKGKLEFDSLLAGDFVNQTAQEGFEPLPITAGHAELAGSFNGVHADPWGRLLAAQARIEQLTLVSIDKQMATFGIAIFW